MFNPTARPIRPQPTLVPAPTLVRTTGDSSIFRGWGVRI